MFDPAAEMMEARDSLNEGWLDCVLTLMAVLTALRQKMWPDDKTCDDLGIARQQCRLYATLFETPRRHWWRRHTIIREITSSSAPSVSVSEVAQAIQPQAPAT